LIVFDNFDSTDIDLIPALNSLGRKGPILITSRQADWTRWLPHSRKSIPRPNQVPESSPGISTLISPRALREHAYTAAGWSLAEFRTNPFSLYRIPVAEPSICGELPSVLPTEPASRILLLLDFDALPELRGNLIRLIDGIRAALCLVLVLVRAALARRLDAPSFLLVLIAISRRYGRRDESDDDALPAHRWTSVIGGELALSS
jgi:hypothetical protein